MKRNIKSMLAALLAVVMCITAPGCESGDSEITEKNIESALKELDSYGQSSDKTSAKPMESSYPEETSKADESSESEKIKYVPTDGILNADFNSGLIQMNNDVFQQGGYATVADFADKYREYYDISYFAPQSGILTELGSYDECKEYLLEYEEPSIGTFDDKAEIKSNYRLKLTPKSGSDSLYHAIKVYIGNVTSIDEKITLDKAVVLGLAIYPDAKSNSSGGVDKRSDIPVWAAYGISVHGALLNGSHSYISGWKKPDETENKFEGYTIKEITEFLDNLGISEVAGEYSGYTMRDVYAAVKECGLAYGKGKNFVAVYAAGEINLFNAKPLYEYMFYFDSNTDKLDYVGYCIKEFFE